MEILEILKVVSEHKVPRHLFEKECKRNGFGKGKSSLLFQ